jgi:hypothetical protein
MKAYEAGLNPSNVEALGALFQDIKNELCWQKQRHKPTSYAVYLAFV